MESFPSKNVLITGGTKGLGLEVARCFVRDGARVFLGYRSDRAGAETAAAELSRRAARDGEPAAVAIDADLSEESGVNVLFDEVARQAPRLDVYVHNAAATAFKDLLELKAHHIDKTFNITVKSLILGAQRAVELMPGGGAIVTVSGMDTLKAVPRHGLLGAAKASLETLTQYLAHELAPKGIRVNGVNPGFLDTDSTRKYLGPAFDLVAGACAASVPWGRMPELSEIAAVIEFLAGPGASWITGQTINVDGGLDFSMPLFKSQKLAGLRPEAQGGR